MNPESQIRNTPATRYFLSAMIATRNILDAGIHLANEGKILGKPMERFQFVVTGMSPERFAKGFYINLN